MKVKLDAIVAEIANAVVSDLLEHDPRFEQLPRPERMHLIVAMLRDRRLVRLENANSAATPYWRPARRLQSYFGAGEHGIGDEHEELALPSAISFLADEASQAMARFDVQLDQIVGLVITVFAMYKQGMLEFCGKEDGLCSFQPSSRSMNLRTKGYAGDYRRGVDD